VLSMLVVDLPSAFGDNTTRTVVLGPAIPRTWANGNVRGLRLRGGGSVDFKWDSHGVVTGAQVHGRNTSLNIVNRDGVLIVKT
jgi:alpha-L-fucosidase 2